MNYPLSKLKDVTKLIYGDTLNVSVRKEGGEVDVYGSNGSFSHHDTANTIGETIIVGRKGSYGEINWSDRSAFVTDTAYFIDCSTTSANLRWLYWLLQTLGLDSGSQDVGVPGLSRSRSYALLVPHPPLPTQTAIANFLDRETRKIDDLISNLSRLIELLKEKRQAAISRAVTKGLNPNVKLKDSHIVSIGEIPEHWEVVPAKRFARAGAGGTAIKSTCFNQPAPHLYPSFSASGQDIWMSDYKHDGPGIVISAVGARCGKCFKADGKWNVAANTHCLFPRNGMDRDYLWYVTNNEEWWEKSGSAQPFVKVADSMSRKWAFPPATEQVAIREFLDLQCSTIDATLQRSQSLIALLLEKRATLISAVVCGQLVIGDEEETAA